MLSCLPIPAALHYGQEPPQHMRHPSQPATYEREWVGRAGRVGRLSWATAPLSRQAMTPCNGKREAESSKVQTVSPTVQHGCSQSASPAGGGQGFAGLDKVSDRSPASAPKTLDSSVPHSSQAPRHRGSTLRQLPASQHPLPSSCQACGCRHWLASCPASCLPGPNCCSAGPAPTCLQHLHPLLLLHLILGLQ